MSFLTLRGSVVDLNRRSTSNDEDLGEVAGLTGTAHGSMRPLHEIIHDLVEAWSPLHTMSKGDEE